MPWAVTVQLAGWLAPGWAAGAQVERARQPWAIPQRYRDRLLRVNAVFQSGREDSAHALIAAMLADARSRRDRRSAAYLLRADGEMWVIKGEGRHAELRLREAIGLAEAVPDSTTLARALLFESVALERLGRLAESRAAARRANRVAIAIGDQWLEGRTRIAFAYQALERGEPQEALTQYAMAIPMLERAHDMRGAIGALSGLGQAHSALGNYTLARQCYLQVAKVAQDSGYAWNQAYAFNNLGALESQFGDPGAAAGWFRKAYELQVGERNTRDWITPLINLAIAERSLGHYREATRLVGQALVAVREQGFRDAQASALEQLGRIASEQGDHAAAARLYREALALGDSVPIWDQARGVLGLARALADLDSSTAALTLLEERGAALRPRVSPELQIDLGGLEGRLLLATGRAAAAAVVLAGADSVAERHGLPGRRMAPLVALARAHRRLGAPDRAREDLDLATADWERARGLPRDPEWRERRGADARELYAELADLTLGPDVARPPDRVRAAFDLLQRFKARTLHERVAGPAHAESPPAFRPVTAAELQGRALRRDELFLDAFMGPDASYLFAVTRAELRVARLPGERDLAPRIRLFRDLLASPPGGAVAPDAWRSASASLSDLLLGPFADLVRDSRRVIVSPDGALDLLPFASLELREGGSPPQPLAARHAIVLAPSATLLAELGRRAKRPAAAAARILAVAGSRNPAGERLGGAEAEVTRLSLRFAGVESRGGPAGAPSTRDLQGCDVLHFAAHTSLDDERPWRSGMLVGAPADTSDPYLRAARLADLDLGARLAVLSGCESAGGRVLSGEGVQGLSAAFLGAGVPCVVATLWPVEDRATVRLVERFYGALARGRAAAEALREAQAALEAERSTSAPFYWAGFVMIGDGDVTVPLRRRPERWVPWAATSVALAAAGAGTLWFRRRSPPAPRASAPRPGAGASGPIVVFV